MEALRFDDPCGYSEGDLSDDLWEALEPRAAPLLKADELDFFKIFDTFVGDTQKTWAHDRNATVGASEVFGCIRKAWFKRNGAEKDPDFKESWGATRRGDLIENHHVVPGMLHGLAKLHPGAQLLFGGADQLTLFDPDNPLSVTPDGLIIGLKRNALRKYGIDDIESDCIAFEIKSIDPRVDLSQEKTIHHGQVQIQLGMFRKLTEHKPVYSVVFYVNASFFDDMKPFPVRFNEEAFIAAQERSQAVFSTKDPTKLMREGAIEGGCEYCPYQIVCGVTTLSAVPEGEKTRRKHAETDPLLSQEMAELVREERRTRKEREKAEKANGYAKERIKLLLRDFNTPRATGEGWKVSYSTSKGRESLDRKAMIDDGIDLSKYMKRGEGLENQRITGDEPVD